MKIYLGGAFFLAILLLLSAEAAARLLLHGSLVLPAVEMPYYTVPDAELVWDIEPNLSPRRHVTHDVSYDIWSNELGCFDRPYAGETPSVYLAGDSFAWGFAPFEAKWGTELERATGVRVLKCGVTGYGTRQELLRAARHFEKIPPPALVVLGYVELNDAQDDALFARGGPADIAAPRTSSAALWLSHNSALFNAARASERFGDLLGRLFPAGAAPPEPGLEGELYERHLETIREFRSLAREGGGELLVVLIQGRGDRDRNIRPFLDGEEIPYLDLFPAFEAARLAGRRLRYPTDSHWDAAGNRLAGLLAAEAILERDMLSPPGREEKLDRVREALRREFPEASER